MPEIVKRYPPNGNLQLLRFASSAPFECWRCRKTKVSKLQAIVELEEPRVLCNGCYGYLLSLAQIKARDIEPWLKAEQIHDLNLKSVSARKAAEVVETQEQRRKQYWKFLSSEARRFIGTAEYLDQLMTDRDDLDFSPLIIELVKSFEYECVRGFVEPMRSSSATQPIEESDILRDCQDKDLGRMARYVFGRATKPPELGTIAHTLTTFVHSKKRVQESRFLQLLDVHIASYRDGQYFRDKDRFVAQVAELTQSYRNPAAHIGYMSRQSYKGCKALLMDAGGALWQLIAAIG